MKMKKSELTLSPKSLPSQKCDSTKYVSPLVTVLCNLEKLLVKH